MATHNSIHSFKKRKKKRSVPKVKIVGNLLLANLNDPGPIINLLLNIACK